MLTHHTAAMLRLRETLVFRVDPADAQTYVLDVALSSGQGAQQQLAASGSDNAIKLYSCTPDGLRLTGKLRGHEGVIGAIRFAKGSDVLWSAAADGNLVAWDTRTHQPGLRLNSQGTASLLSMDIACDNSLIAAGTAMHGDDARVVFWDPRSGGSVKEFVECHMDDVTQLRFHPTRPDVLATAGEDCLVNILELRADFDEDESLESVMNVGQTASRIGFFGQSGEYVYCATNVETLSLWRTMEADKLADFGDVRVRLAAASVDVDYIIDCTYDATRDKLLLLAGTFAGEGRVLDVTKDDITPVATLPAAHVDRIRCADWNMAVRKVTIREELFVGVMFVAHVLVLFALFPPISAF